MCEHGGKREFSERKFSYESENPWKDFQFEVFGNDFEKKSEKILHTNVRTRL